MKNINEEFLTACRKNDQESIDKAMMEGADVFYNDGEALTIFCIDAPNLLGYMKVLKPLSFEQLLLWHKNNINTIRFIDEALDQNQNSIELKNINGESFTKNLKDEGVIYINPFSQAKFQKYYDPKQSLIKEVGFCCGLSTLYATREINKENNPSKPNNTTIEKLYAIGSKEISGAINRIATFQGQVQGLVNSEQVKIQKTILKPSELSSLKTEKGLSYFFIKRKNDGHATIINKFNKLEGYNFFDPNFGDIKVNGHNVLLQEIEKIFVAYNHNPENLIHQIQTCNSKEWVSKFKLAKDKECGDLSNKINKYFPEKVTLRELAKMDKISLEKVLCNIIKQYWENLPQEYLQLFATWAVYTKSTDVLKLLIEEPNFNINFQDKNGATLLQEAIYRNDMTLLKLLLENKADVHVKDEFGNNLLHNSVNDLENLKLLVEYCKDINEKNTDGDTLLNSIVKHIALCKSYQYELPNIDGYIDFIKLIINEYGADPAIKNNENVSAFDLVKTSDNITLNDIFGSSEEDSVTFDNLSGVVEEHLN